jgi:hypothetical protein
LKRGNPLAVTPFASKTLVEHLLRGAVGIAALVFAIRVGFVHPLLALGLGIAMVVAFRGCPICWTTGLIETLHNHRKPRQDPPSA